MGHHGRASTLLDAPGHLDELATERTRLLGFAEASRHAEGGFAWLDSEGRGLLDRPVETWITCRMTHVFALGHLLPVPGCERLVDHGVSALESRLRDEQHGGWFGAVAGAGPVIADKRAYEHAFVVLAASSAGAADRPGGAPR